MHSLELSILWSLFPLFLLSYGWLIASGRTPGKQRVHTYLDIANINKASCVTACVEGDTYPFNLVLIDLVHLPVRLWN